MSWLNWISLGSLSAMIAVGMGAFGSHALRAKLSERHLEVFQLSTHYQLIHALALIAVGLVASRMDHPGIKIAGFSFLAGTVLFCGSLYGLTLTKLRLGIVTPIGGVAFITGWAALAWATLPFMKN